MKKSEFITFRTTPATKTTLEEIAASRKWSISLLVEEIVQEWMQQQAEKNTDKNEPEA